LDVVLIDTTWPASRDHLFPRGTLREPTSGLKRAGVVVLTRCDQATPAAVDEVRGWLVARFPGKPVATSEHRPVDLLGGDGPEPVEGFRGRVVAGFCGIGNPPGFRRTLESLGGTV